MCFFFPLPLTLQEKAVDFRSFYPGSFFSSVTHQPSQLPEVYVPHTAEQIRSSSECLACRLRVLTNKRHLQSYTQYLEVFRQRGLTCCCLLSFKHHSKFHSSFLPHIQMKYCRDALKYFLCDLLTVGSSGNYPRASELSFVIG